MKNLLKRVMSIAAATALLMTSVISASAADPGHSHKDGKPITTEPDPSYTITLKHPNSEEFVKGDDTTGSHYGAYQIFSGTVPEVGDESYEKPDTNPGDTNQKLPITDIKWGSAFCSEEDTDLDPTNDDTGRENILKFIYALYNAPKGSYSYAFSDLTEFGAFIVDDSSTIKLNSKYVTSGDVTFTVDGDGKVTKIDNPENVNYDKLAVEVADIIAGKTDREWLQEFNDILGGFGQGDDGAYKNPGYVNRYYEGSVNDANTREYKITVPAGYYMIRDLSSFTGTDKSYSARMLFVANNIVQNLKESVPTLEKHIVRDGAQYETEAAGVGDEVEFRLTGTLPSNYDLYLGGYQYKFTDELSDGLTLKEIKADPKTYVTVKVKGVYDEDEAFVDKEYTIETTSVKADVGHEHDDVGKAYVESYDETENKLTVTFPCLKEIEITDGSDKYTLGVDSQIYVTYTAVVNENAVVSPKGTAADDLNGNTNTATLTYSDNPQSYGDTDTTTPDNATVYTFGVDIVKVDAAEFLRNGKTDGSVLANAKFSLVRPKDGTTGADTTWQIASFDTVTAAQYEAMDPKPNVPASFKNGYYTIIEWEDISSSTATAKGDKFNDAWLSSYTDNKYKITSLSNGALNISGLDDGITYTLVETDTPDPDDYAKIDPFTFSLTAATTTGDEYTGRLSGANSAEDTTGAFSFDKPVDITDTFGATDDGSANMLVANFKYTDLPSTGGIGVYIYYIAGGCAVVLALVLFALSKKKRSDK